MNIPAIAFIVLVGLSSSVFAADGNDWTGWSSGSKLREIGRVIASIRARGCVVKNSPEYFVRQLNDFYREAATRSLELPKAFALIATGAGERWDC